MGIFQKGTITGDIFSNILNHHWECINKKIESKIKNTDLYNIHQFISTYENGITFGKLAKEFDFSYKKDSINYNESANTVFDKLYENLTFSTKYYDIDIFERSGFIFADDLEAAGMGQFNYIYRAKGSRTYWFRDGKIIWKNVYAEIDENRAVYWNEPTLDIIWNMQNNENDVNDDMGNFTVPKFLRNLVNIQKDYIRSYPLEYIFNPHDVYVLSDFSIMLRKELWGIILNTAKEGYIKNNTEQIESFRYFSEFFRQLNIEISAEQILEFISSISEFEESKVKFIIDNLRVAINHSYINETFHDSILHACQKLQNIYIYRNSDENSRNTYIRDILKERRPDYNIYDQTLRGRSFAGKKPGEVDLYIENKLGVPYTYIEALNLSNIDKQYIDRHIEKIWLYDTLGVEHNYIIIYYEGKNFLKFRERYKNFLNKNTSISFPVNKLIDKKLPWSEIFEVDLFTERNGQEQKIIHIVINMNSIDLSK